MTITGISLQTGDMIVSVFSDRLKQEMKGKNVKQKVLAAETGISSVSISYYITGKRDPSLKHLQKICTALDVSADYLLEIETSERKEEAKRAESAADSLYAIAEEIEAIYEMLKG